VPAALRTKLDDPRTLPRGAATSAITTRAGEPAAQHGKELAHPAVFAH
jgi:hypothetical protein